MADHRATLTKLYELIYSEVDKLDNKQQQNKDATLSSTDRDSLIEYLKVLRQEKEQQDKQKNLSTLSQEELDKLIADELSNLKDTK